MSIVGEPPTVTVEEDSSVKDGFPKIFEELHQKYVREYPSDGVEIVDWMHYAAAVEDLSFEFAQSVRRAGRGASFSYVSGDPTIPHVYMGDGTYYVKLIPGWQAATEGMTIIRASDNAVVASGIMPGQKAWTSDKGVQGLHLFDWGYQWLAMLFKWVQAPKIPSLTLIGVPVYASAAGPLGPSIIFSYTSRPSILKIFQVKMKTAGPGESQFVFRLWNGNKQTVSETKPVTLRANVGYRVIVNFRYPTLLNGYLEIDPVVAPGNGWSITSVNMWPLSING